MSLNGLDEPKVIEAHEVAAAEPGGWFLLNYASRDEVELLGRGSGGLVEIRDVVAAYDQESPLYGFLRYRRRNVVIKYLPEDCSRLIRARVVVHFNAVCERFSPHDTIFEISAAAELRDTKLSAACSLHAASGSTSSSSSSSRRRRLVEIAEEDEEDQRALRRPSVVSTAYADADADAERPQTPANKTLPSDPVLLNSDPASSPEATRFSSSTTRTTTTQVPYLGGERDGPTSPARSIEPDTLSYYSPHPTGKPRVKLGPRPSQADSTIRPQTAGNFKPVSSIPVGLKLFGKAAKKGKSKDRDTDKEKARDGNPAIAIATTASTLTLNDLSAPELTNSVQEDATGVCRPGSSTSLTSLAPPAPVPTKPTITPEKARLMKAMQLREKKKKTMAAAKAEQEAGATPAHADTTTEIHVQDNTVKKTEEDTHDVIHEGNEGEEAEENEKAQENGVDGVDGVDEKVEEEEEEAGEEEEGVSNPTHTGAENDNKTGEQEAGKATSTEKEKRIPLTPTDSGVVLDSPVPSAHLDEISETTYVDLCADSPIIVSPETDHSPMASSLSELTDETVQAKDDEHHEAEHVQQERKEDDDKNIEAGGEESPRPEARGTENAQSTDQTELDSAITEPAEAEAERNDTGQVEIAGEVEMIDDEESPKLLVPKSKFSTQDPVSVSKAGSTSSSVILSPQSEPERSQVEENALGGKEHEEEKKVEEVTATATEAEEQEAKPTPTAIQTDVSSKNLSIDSSDLGDDNSSVQDAVLAPISENVRTVSNPNHPLGSLAVPSDPSHSLNRSGSSGAAFLNKINKQQQQSSGSSTVIVKPIVGSSISQRIKALEKLSAESADSSRPVSRDRPSSSFFAVSRRDAGSPSVAERANSLRKHPAPAPPYGSPVTRNRSPSLTSQISRFDSSRGRQQSTRNRLDDSKELAGDDHDRESVVSERTSMSLEREAKSAKRSSVIMNSDFIREHRKSATISADMQQILSSAIPSSRPSSSAQYTNNNTISSRISISSRRSSINKDRDHAFMTSPIADDEKGNKMMSRTERFMRRLSNIPGARGKGSVPLSTPVTEEGSDAGSRRPQTGGPGDARVGSAGGEASAGVVADMGDVNVQFPDNLLWKRRNMCLDAQGFLILSASVQNSKAAAVGTKRYHLSDFRQPYTPDVEVQELPNSVVLDFVEGSGIQVACEDRSGQLHVLKVLREAHASHSTFGK